jgi:hypothetical protein
MVPFKLTGPKELKLDAAEVAYILDALADKPFKVAAPLIDKIVEQARDKPEIVEGEVHG